MDSVGCTSWNSFDTLVSLRHFELFLNRFEDPTKLEMGRNVSLSRGSAKLCVRFYAIDVDIAGVECGAKGVKVKKTLIKHKLSAMGIFAARMREDGSVTGYPYGSFGI